VSIEALIFDVDGTLADTEECHRQAFNQAFDEAELGWHWSPVDYKHLLKTTGGKERMAAHLHTLALPEDEQRRVQAMIPALHAAKTRIYTALVHAGRVPLRPGVARLLAEAREAGLRLGIATTTSAENVDALLAATLGEAGTALFEVIACGDQVPRKKPAPDIFKLALDTLGLPPERAVALEDSGNGLRAARAAGLWTVVTPSFWTADDDLSDAQLVLPHLGDPVWPLPFAAAATLQGARWLSARALVSLAGTPAPAPTESALDQGMAR
jgi:HAD superfamily hydrolase (TIGR01509 family)